LRGIETPIFLIDHIARDLFKPPPEPAAEKSDKPEPTTDSGMSIEEQVRKQWDPGNGGLPRFWMLTLQRRKHPGARGISGSMFVPSPIEAAAQSGPYALLQAVPRTTLQPLRAAAKPRSRNP